VSVVPHTHWDREWYEPFQTFRYRLVDLLDELLPRLDADPAYAHFMLDGQMAVIDDHVAVRPDAANTIRRLAASGRLSVGPWYILMDEFLVSGEAMVRNLQLGLERAAAYGGAMPVGYLPDMFGHVAQMPQLLRQFGFEHAVVWRGVPNAVDRSAFWWQAPDGSSVRAEYLPQGYGNGASTPDDAKALVARVRDFAAEWDDLLVGPLLWMNGTDHQLPQAWLGRVVAEAN
jgi:alpha-mannosidase